MHLLICGTLITSLLLAATGAGASMPDETYDVVVYGGTSAGIMAAVQARRMDKSVVVVCPDRHLGGLSSGGLGWTDTGDKTVIGGLAREFYHRVWQHYQDENAWRWQGRDEYGNRGQGAPAMDGEFKTMWIFEPHVAEQVFENFVREYDIPVYRDEWLDREHGVAMDDGRITAITMLSGNTYRGRMFMDATYEGDLMAAAGVSYHVGREANSVYNETLNGVQTERAVSHQFKTFVDPYVEAGNPDSGLLPRIHGDSPGVDGEGDHRVQAYCFRVCLTQVPENRKPFPKPDNYDPMQYELLGRYIDTGIRHIFGKFDPIPNAKTDTNNHGAFSTDNIGMNYDYPEASYERRREIIQEHEEYQKGYFWFLANDPRVPEDVREEMSQWGLARDEFLDNDHWPHQLYIREARRMVSDFVVTERHLRRQTPTPRPIGMGSYNMDSHNVQRYVAYDAEGRGHARNEGDIQISPGGPYPIDYGAIVPKQEECENLFVLVCVSTSHIAFGSVRMEPVFMILGQSAATAAALALDKGIPVQAVDYDELAQRLQDDGQVLAWQMDGHNNIDPDKLSGIVADNPAADLTGPWRLSRSVSPMVGLNYAHDSEDKSEVCMARYHIPVPAQGNYEVRISYSAHPNRATNAQVAIHHLDGIQTALVNQRETPPIDDLFVSLGAFTFEDNALIVISNKNADGHVIADAVQLIAEDAPNP